MLIVQIQIQTDNAITRDTKRLKKNQLNNSLQITTRKNKARVTQNPPK